MRRVPLARFDLAAFATVATTSAGSAMAIGGAWSHDGGDAARVIMWAGVALMAAGIAGAVKLARGAR